MFGCFFCTSESTFYLHTVQLKLCDCVVVIHGRHRQGGRHEGDRYESASMMSSDIETTSYQDSSDDQSR